MFSLRPKKETVTAIVDIGSGSAGFSIAIHAKDKPVTIAAADRAILPLEDRTPEQTMSGVIRMIGEAGKNVLKTYLTSEYGKRFGPPEEAYAVIRAPWTRVSSSHATRVSEKEELVTKEMITELAQKALLQDADIDRANILDSSVIRVELNEYPSPAPIGKKAHRLDVVTFESDCDPIMKKMITDALLALLPGRNPSLRSGARAYLSVIEEQLKHPQAYVIIDMVSEATTCMAVRDGIITHHAIIPEGVRTILRRVAGVQGMSEEILSLMKMVVADSCSGEACDTLNAALAKIEPELVRVFGEAFAGFVGKRRLPDTLFVTAHPDITAWLAHVFSRIDFSQFTVTMRPFSVEALSKENLKSAVIETAGLQTDIGNLFACAFVNMQKRAS